MRVTTRVDLQVIHRLGLIVFLDYSGKKMALETNCELSKVEYATRKYCLVAYDVFVGTENICTVRECSKLFSWNTHDKSLENASTKLYIQAFCKNKVTRLICAHIFLESQIKRFWSYLYVCRPGLGPTVTKNVIISWFFQTTHSNDLFDETRKLRHH